MDDFIVNNECFLHFIVNNEIIHRFWDSVPDDGPIHSCVEHVPDNGECPPLATPHHSYVEYETDDGDCLPLATPLYTVPLLLTMYLMMEIAPLILHPYML
jgi:hypothetical protein